MYKYCSHGTLLHFSLQSSHLNICYYYQDLHQVAFHTDLRLKLRYTTCALLHACPNMLAQAVGYRLPASAPSIFGASPFGR